MINLKDYIKAKRIENKKLKKERKKEYKNNILELEKIVNNTIKKKQTKFVLKVGSQTNLIIITNELDFKKESSGPWEFLIKMNLLSLWLLKREVKKVKKWRIK